MLQPVRSYSSPIDQAEKSRRSQEINALLHAISPKPAPTILPTSGRDSLMQGLHKLYYPYIDIVALRGKDMNGDVEEGVQKLLEYVQGQTDDRKSFFNAVKNFIDAPDIYDASNDLEVAGQAYALDYDMKNNPEYQ